MKSIYLSPSTQEANSGAGNYGSEELVMNKVTDVLQTILRQSGVICYRNDPGWNLYQVVADSNEKRPNVHFAIHSNAGGGRGCEVFAYAPGGEGEKLARAVYAEIEPLTPTTDRGVKYSQKLYELRATDAPAALIEIAFHDNFEDASWILDNIQVIGEALAEGILGYFGIALPTPDPELEDAINVLHQWGIMQCPEYWRVNAVANKVITGELAAILIKRVAARILKGGS